MIFDKIEFPEIKYNIIAGFTSRNGGISKPPFKSLNLGRFTDDPDIGQNYNILNKTLDISPINWCWLKQVHGNNIINVNEPGLCCEGDGMFTSNSELFLAVQTADCIPLIFAHKNEQFIAVLHAGWKGLQKNISAKFLSIAKTFSLHPENFLVAVGPHLKQCHFKVTEEFLAYFNEKYYKNKDGKHYFDPSHIIHEQLLQSGIHSENIISTSYCTFCETDYYSYRREGKTGRQIGFIGIF